MARGVAAIGSSYIAIGLHTGEVSILKPHTCCCPPDWVHMGENTLNITQETARFYFFMLSWMATLTSAKLLGGQRKSQKTAKTSLKYICLNVSCLQGSATTSVQSPTWRVPTPGLER